ncbi:TonB-dependent receptor [Subsaximicrobium wynnwilliamsii]|uniref:TonB-dependent receptor n=1 Tax=Subsaximicrobium wynnwilliamsii TaxID=291179 RepID=A0A5C6ZID8_9FLAO|nr:outer membrane beta-barrel family protein [Subsaximicrobium wynnwilliamsii]TXD82950.1 TonB-dependent receptor [Subsaximicrobium wynnwilliamsii]TXD88671.1 TonB-dependent receptor [Subsaximicrobium wynnwilliamsii]TXE02764.1 TonB-dependent receptor [Subsaximicrobium wynnwilliamsii]
MNQILSALSLMFLCSLSSLSAQNKINISGTVVDSQEKYPLEYATISFFNPNGSEAIEGGITDLEGKFNIEVVPGNYDLKIEYLSYKSKTYKNKSLTKAMDLGTVGLEVDMAALDQVTIVAERTTVEIKLDKKIYNIGSDLTTAGGTVSDALNNVPSVAVDVEGGISLRGNENVTILINGKPSAMAGFGDTNVLSQLPAEAIERVEVITSPSARYDAEGTAGILNIILRQKETLGFNGSITLNLGNPDLAGIAANLNYRTEKFNLFSNIGFRYDDAPRNSFSDANYFDRLIDGALRSPEYERIVEDQQVERNNRGYNANVGMEYFLSDKTSLTGSIFYRYKEDADISNNDSERFNNNAIVERTLRIERENQDENSYQLALNYMTKFNDEGHELTADFQFEEDRENQNTFINEDYLLTQDAATVPFQKEQIFATEDQKEFLFQADYVLPIGEDARFEAGYRGNFENEITDYRLEQEDLSDASFFVNDTITNLFDYEENVNAVYSQYGNKFGKFSFLLGLRLENTQLKGTIDSRLSDEELVEAFGFPIDTDFNNNYLGLFPTVNLIYNLGKDEDQEESLTLGYNRRINRPRSWYINPFPTRSSRTRVFQGNPNLNPAFSSAFDLGYLKRWDKFTWTTSVYYQYESDSFERVEENTGQRTTDGIDIIRTIPVNLSNNIRTGAELGILYNPKKWLRLNSSINFFQFKTEGEFNGIDYGAKNTSWFARFSGKVTLPGNIDWQTNAFYRGAEEGAQTRTEGLFSMDLAISKEVLKNKATVSLNVRDVFNSRIRNQFTTTEFFQRYSESQWRQRQVTLSLLYRFNMKKEKSRNGSRENGNEFEFEG